MVPGPGSTAAAVGLGGTASGRSSSSGGRSVSPALAGRPGPALRVLSLGPPQVKPSHLVASWGLSTLVVTLCKPAGPPHPGETRLLPPPPAEVLSKVSLGRRPGFRGLSRGRYGLLLGLSRVVSLVVGFLKFQVGTFKNHKKQRCSPQTTQPGEVSGGPARIGGCGWARWLQVQARL